MSWLTRGTNSATGLTTWATGQTPAASDFNALGLDVRTWGANVDAGGYSLLNCANVNSAVAVTTYNFTAQAPGGSLAAGSNTITLTPVPAGLNGADVGHYLYLSGGAGAAEAVLITGGSAVAGGASGTVIFTCANTHSGAWTVASATSGIYEAIQANPGREIRIPTGVYTMRAGIVIDPTKPLLLTGEGASATGTYLNFAAVTTMPAIQIVDTSVTNSEPKMIRNLMLQGTGTSTGNDGIYLSKVIRVTLDCVQVNSFALDGVHTSDALEITIQNGCQILYCGQWGVHFAGISNLCRISRSYIGSNSRSNNAGNVFIIGTSAVSPTEQITLDGADIEGAGILPFTTVTTAWGLLVQWVTGITVANCYFEGNLTNAIIYQGATSCVTEFNNWINSSPILYASDTTGVRSWGNTFFGTSAVRSIACPMSEMTIGGDRALNSSPEVTNHRATLGVPGTTGAGSAALGANSPAVTNTAPYTWLKILGPDGSVVYIPAWK